MRAISFKVPLSVLFLIGCSLICVFPAVMAHTAQAPQTQWSSTYNALSSSSIVQTNDSGFLAIGLALIYSNNQESALLKVDSSGNQVWLKNIVSFRQDNFLAKTKDGGFAVATTSSYSDTDNSGQTRNFFGFYVSRFDAEGNNLWNRTYGDGVRSLTAFSFSSTLDGGFIIGGDAHYYDPLRYTTSADDIIILKTDAEGNELWNRTYGGGGDDILKTVDQTSDGGFMLTAYSNSFKDSQATWLLKTDPLGSIQWSKVYSSSDLGLKSASLNAFGGFETMDNGCFVFGVSTDNQNYQNAGLVMKTDSQGNIQWTQSYPNAVNYAIQTNDGAYVIATESPGGTTQLIQTDSSGAIQWNMTYHVSIDRYGKPLIQATDGGLVLTGTNSNRLWILKTAPLQKVQPVPLPNPKPFAYANASVVWQYYFDGVDCKSITSISDGGYALAGETALFQNGALGSQAINYSSVLIRTDAFGKLVFRKELPIGDMISQDNSSFQTIINSVDVFMNFIVQSSDGGYVLAGTTTLKRNSGSYSNFCMAKTDAQGNLLWVQQYDFRDDLAAFTPTLDGGYVLAGGAGYYPGRVTHLVKTDSEGKVLWNANLSLNKVAQVISTNDGGYTLLGSTYAYASGSQSGSAQIVHVSSNGNVMWTNYLSVFSPQTGILTKDGGYLITGLSNPQTYVSSSVLLKLDNLGNISWYKLYDNQPFYYPKSLIASQDGGFLFVATTPDYRCVVKVDENGTVEKVLTLDSLWTSYNDNSVNIVQAGTGNYVIAGKYVGLNTTEYSKIWFAKIDAERVQIAPSPSVPEFPSFIFIPILLSAMLAVTIIYRRKLRTQE